MVRTWKLRIILQRMNITYWIYFKEWAKKTTRKRYVHEKIEFHIVQPVKRKSSSEMKRNKSDMIFLLKGNKIAKKSFISQRSDQHFSILAISYLEGSYFVACTTKRHTSMSKDGLFKEDYQTFRRKSLAKIIP